MNKDKLKNLEGYLEEYKNITLKLILSLEKDDIDSLTTLLNKRDDLINKLKSISYESLDFKEVCSRLDILPLEQKLTTITRKKMDYIRGEIERLGENKTANKSYNKKFSVDSIYLSKKI